MKRFLVKDLMVPISEYATVSLGSTLSEAVSALEKAQEEYDHTHYRHRAVLVLDNKKQVVGKLSQMDFLRSLESRDDKIERIKEIRKFGFSSKSIALQQEQHYLHERVVKDNIQLEDYATLGLSDELENWYTTHFTGLTIEQVEQDPQAALEHAIDLIAEKYDIIGFQTNLPDVAERLQRAACFGDAFENALTNQTRKRLSLREISDQARQSIADANAVDVKLYTALQQRFG